MTYRTAPIDEGLDLLAANEQIIGRLYSAYAARFTDAREFWQYLAGQEDSHAQTVRGLMSLRSQGAVRFKSDRFRTEPIRLSIRHTENEILAAASRVMPLVNALSIARAIEQSLLESRVLEVFETDAPETQQMLQRLSRETQVHARIIAERWQQLTSHAVNR